VVCVFCENNNNNTKEKQQHGSLRAFVINCLKGHPGPPQKKLQQVPKPLSSLVRPIPLPEAPWVPKAQISVKDTGMDYDFFVVLKVYAFGWLRKKRC